MDKKKLLVSSALAAAFAFTTPTALEAGKGKKHKCYGAFKKGDNHCGAEYEDGVKHGCKNQSTKDYHPNDWKYMHSKDECQKAVEKAKEDGAKGPFKYGEETLN